MFIEILGALIQVIDFVFKRKEHYEKIDEDLLAKNLIAMLIDLERVEKNSDKIRWYFFYMERDKDEPERVEKWKKGLKEFIPVQTKTLWDINERYKGFQHLFEIYSAHKSLPENIKDNFFTAKQHYLGRIIHSMEKDGDNFEYTRSETAKEQLEKIHLFKKQLAKIIKKHIPLIDFVKWYDVTEKNYESNELQKARDMRLNN